MSSALAKKLLPIVFMLSVLPAFSQDIYDAGHSLKFAGYLYVTRQYPEAIREFERLSYFMPANDSLDLQLLKCYRKNGQYDKVLSRSAQLYPNKAFSPAVNMEYARALLLKHAPDSASLFISGHTFPSALKKDELSVTGLLYTFQLQEARSRIFRADSAENPSALLRQYRSILLAHPSVSRKSPALAGTLSALVPGLGKVYTKDYKDAIFAFLLSAGTGFASYRAFHKKGIESGLGWVYGTASAAFYLGNIYGSVKAAKVYNQKRKDRILHAVEDAFVNQSDD